jgi:ferredoxin
LLLKNVSRVAIANQFALRIQSKEGAIVFEINKKTCTECNGDYDVPQCVKVCPIDNCILQA